MYLSYKDRRLKHYLNTFEYTKVLIIKVNKQKSYFKINAYIQDGI